MATQTDEIVVRFKTEGGEDVEQTFQKTAAASDQFHQKVTKAGGALGDLRLKSEGRVANNLGVIAQSLTGGANAGEVFATAITKASESFRGSLLFAGAATIGFALYQGITKAGEAAIKLTDDIANLKRASLLSGDFLGSDQINKNLDATIAKIDELQARFAKEHTGLAGQFNQALRGALQLTTRPQLEAKDLAEAQALREAGLNALSQTAEKQRTLNDLATQHLLGDEREAALAKITADHNERSARIEALAAKLGIQGAHEAQAAEQSRTDLETVAANKQFDLQDKGFELQRRIVSAEKELLSPAEENLKILGLRAAALQDIASKTIFLTNQERQAANNAAGGAQAAFQRAQLNTFLEGPASFVSKGVRDRLNKQLYDQARERYNNAEERRRAGLGNDVRNPGLRAYEEAVFGQAPKVDAATQVVSSVQQLIHTLLALPAKIGVG